MKKTLLATAIAGALGVSAAAQAATVYSQDGTEVDVYGRIAMAVTSGGEQSDAEAKEDGSQIRNLGSRLGFRARHELDADLSVFANMEFRFDAAQRDGGIGDTRQSFLGVQSQQFGRVWAGNFNSIYYNAVGSVFDVPENSGWAENTLGSVTNSSHGTSIAYSTPELEGFQVHVQAKHYSGNDVEIGNEDASSTTSPSAAVSYTFQDLYIAAGYDRNRDFGARARAEGGTVTEAANSDEAIWGVAAAYQFTPAFSARLGYETTSSNDSALEEGGSEGQYMGRSITSVGATFDYGMGEIYGQYARSSWDNTEFNDNRSSENQWMLGANYRFSQPMYVFAEVYDSDYTRFDADETTLTDLSDGLLYTVGARYDF